MIVSALFLTAALSLGVGIANLKFKQNALFYGSILGVFFGTWIVLLFSLAMDFSEASIIGASAFCAVTAIFLFKKKKLESKRLISIRAGAVALLFLFFLFLSATQTFHWTEQGDLASEFFADTSFHLSTITSMAKGVNFPPNYPFLPAEPLTYTFLPNFFSAILLKGGFDLLASFITYNVLLQTSFTVLLYSFSKKIVGKKWALLAVFLALYVGSIYLLETPFNLQNPTGLRNIFDYNRLREIGYHLPANIQTIIDSRSFLMGFAISLIVFERLYEKKEDLFDGALIGLLPLFHASVIPLAIGAGTYSIYKSIKEKALKNVRLLTLAAMLAIPQLLYLTSNKDLSGINPWFGWMNEEPTIIAGLINLIRNFGFWIALLIAGLTLVKGRKRALLAAFSVPAIIGFSFKLSPWPFDDIKMFLFWGLLACIFGAMFIKEKLKDKGVKTYLVATVVILLMVSGGLLGQFAYMFLREPYENISGEEILVCQYIEENLPKDAVLLTRGKHSCVYVLAGRKVFLAEERILWTHGINASQYIEENKKMLEGDCGLINKYGITHYYDGGGYSGFQELILMEPKIIEKSALEFQNGHTKLYKINCS